MFSMVHTVWVYSNYIWVVTCQMYVFACSSAGLSFPHVTLNVRKWNETTDETWFAKFEINWIHFLKNGHFNKLSVTNANIFSLLSLLFQMKLKTVYEFEFRNEMKPYGALLVYETLLILVSSCEWGRQKVSMNQAATMNTKREGVCTACGFRCCCCLCFQCCCCFLLRMCRCVLVIGRVHVYCSFCLCT